MPAVDWIVLGVVLVAALGGLRRGLVVSALSLGGLVAGAYAGSRIAPHLFSGGASSRWAPLAGLVGALAGAALLEMLASVLGSFVRGGLRLTPLRFLDSAGGLVLGAAMGLVLVWVAGAAALLLPGQTALREQAQRSEIVGRLNERVPPRELLNLLARVDPFPSILGPLPPASPGRAELLHHPAIVRAGRSVVKVVGTACGIGIEGSGWFVRPTLVVTNAHVVAGERDTAIEIPGRDGTYRAAVVAFDARNDIAVLRVDAAVVPLELVDPKPGTSVAILGYPENGPLSAIPGRIGTTSTVVTPDGARTITAVAGGVRHGNSGGPAVDARGRVQSTIFAARVGAPAGYGIPASVVRSVVASAAQDPVSTGSC